MKATNLYAYFYYFYFSNRVKRVGCAMKFES